MFTRPDVNVAQDVILTFNVFQIGLQRVDAENLPPVVGVTAPIVDDVENLRPDDSGEDHDNTEVPGVVAIDALLFRVANADPKSDQHARGDEHTISGQVETAYVKKSGEHVSLDAPNEI